MKQHGPWKIKSSEVKYKNPWIEIREDQVIRPDGEDGIYGVVDMKHGVSVLALDEDDCVYLTDEFQYAIGEQSLEVVSGGVDQNEDSLMAAKRELKEEAGIEAKEWIDLGKVNPFTSVINSSATIYLARKLNFTSKHQDGTETLKIVRVKFDEAVNMVMSGKITHAQSCVLILKAVKYLGKLV